MTNQNDIKTRLEDTGVSNSNEVLNIKNIFTLCEEMELELSSTNAVRSRFPNLHLTNQAVRNVCLDENIVKLVKEVLGENIVLWNSVLLVKEPGGRSIPWHQDYQFLPIHPKIGVWVWLALTPASRENGCLEIVPGSCKYDYIHLPRASNRQFLPRADTRAIDLSARQCIIGDAGNFVILHNKVLHCSGPNLTVEKRMALVIRFLWGQSRMALT